jgi:hypothetical protein
LKLIQERAGNTWEGTGIGKDFLSRKQAAHQLRERIDKWDYMKLKSFCTTKEMFSKLNNQQKIFAENLVRYISDKELITRMYRELKKLNSPNTNDPMKKWANRLRRVFLKEEVQMA